MAAKSQLFGSIQTLIDVFTKYAAMDCEQGQKKGCDGEPCLDQFMMSKREFKEMMQKEFGCEDVKDQATFDEMMNEIDDDGDGQLNFSEFVSMVTNTATACYIFKMLGMIEEQAEKAEKEG